MRAAAPAARKPTCLRRPVIRADGEFWRGGSLRNEGRICVNPRELNVTKKGACRNSVGFEPSLLMRQPLFNNNSIFPAVETGVKDYVEANPAP